MARNQHTVSLRGAKQRQALPLSATAVPDSHGLNLYHADPALTRLVSLYLPADMHRHLTRHLDRRGARPEHEVVFAIGLRRWGCAAAANSINGWMTRPMRRVTPCE